MAVSRPPQRKKTNTAPAGKGEDKRLDEFINAGGSVPKAAAPAPKKEAKKGVLLQLPESLVEAIDAAVADHPARLSRRQWIEAAIRQQLQS